MPKAGRQTRLRILGCFSASGVRHRPTETAHIADQRLSESFAHRMNQHIDCVAPDFPSPAIDAVFELAARQDRAWPLQKTVHERKLACRKRCRNAVAMQ